MFVVIEYVDFLCPDCLYLTQQLDKLKKEFEGKINIAFQFFPLDAQCNSVVDKNFHPGACELSYMAVKKDGRRQRFDSQNIMRGLLRACEKRPVPVAKLEEIVEEIELKLQEKPDKENMKKGFVLGTQVVERIFDILAMCFLLAVFLFFKSYYAPYFNPDKETYSILTFTGIGAVAFVAFILILIFSIYFFRDRTLSVIARILKPLPQKVTSKIHVLIEEFIEGLKFFHSIGNILIYMLLSVIVWLGITFFFLDVFFSLIMFLFLSFLLYLICS